MEKVQLMDAVKHMKPSQVMYIHYKEPFKDDWDYEWNCDRITITKDGKYRIQYGWSEYTAKEFEAHAVDLFYPKKEVAAIIEVIYPYIERVELQ